LKSPSAPRRTNQNRGVSANRTVLRVPEKSRLTKEQTMNYVLCSFREDFMVRAVVEEAAALTSIALFLGMIAVWAQVISAL
jgi:hypothetical protein